MIRKIAITFIAVVAIFMVITILTGCGDNSGMSSPTVNAGNDRVEVMSTQGKINIRNHTYTVIKDKPTGCTIMIVESSMYRTMGVTTLSCN